MVLTYFAASCLAKLFTAFFILRHAFVIFRNFMLRSYFKKRKKGYSGQPSKQTVLYISRVSSLMLPLCVLWCLCMFALCVEGLTAP